MHTSSRKNLMVPIPANKLRPEMQEKLRDHERRIENLERRIKYLGELHEARLSLFKGNAVLDLAKLLDNGSLNQTHSTTYLLQLATNATEKQLIKAGIPKKYWRIVRGLPAELIDAHYKSAHGSEIDFARLLISGGPDTHNYQFWKEIFPLLYGGTVEQVAERENNYEKLAKLESSDD